MKMRIRMKIMMRNDFVIKMMIMMSIRMNNEDERCKKAWMMFVKDDKRKGEKWMKKMNNVKDY